MNCADIQEKMSLYIDDLLDAHDKQLVEEHLLQCKSCSLEYETLMANTEALKRIPEVPLPAGFKEELHTKLVAEQKKKKSKDWRSYTVIAAAVLIMVVSALQNQFFDHKNLTVDEAASEEEAPRTGSKWTLANDSQEKSMNNSAMFSVESAPESIEMDSMTEGIAMLSDDNAFETYEAQVTIKGDTLESAAAYFREYIIISSYYITMKVNEDEILLEVSPGGFDLLLDHVTAYSKVDSYNVNVISLTEQFDYTASEPDEDVSLKAIEDANIKGMNRNDSAEMQQESGDLPEEVIEDYIEQPIRNATIIIEVIE